MRFLYAFSGAFLGAIVDLAVNLLASVIQQRPIGARILGQQGMAWLIGLIVGGLVLGLWLGTSVRLHPQDHYATPRPSAPSPPTQPITMTRLRALLSYGRLRGQGIVLADILLVGSVLDIDTRK